ncbi:FGGY family carbohydrate kinase, partial [Rhodoblastus sp.]|uniref:FGGY family carbohydrate kinase n=1 Tax=Rhodoblastus sp. TaxID=1962975 RepID=UPI003F97663D
MSKYVGAIDQGTTSTRFIIFDSQGEIVSMDQKEHEQIYPRAGWVEHDPAEIWRNTQTVIRGALAKKGLSPADIVSVGVTNQRETTVIWNRRTGQAPHNALVWMDTRTDDLVREFTRGGGQDRLRAKTGLPLATYFSGLKLRWLLDRTPGAQKDAEAGDLLFGTMDAWIAWNLTGGVNGGRHITDVTNASRTQLMNLESLDWDRDILNLFDIPRACLPEICSSSETMGLATGVLANVPLAGILGDQQAALFGQTCFERGEAKSTYGTGSFLLVNTGEQVVRSDALLTSVAAKVGDAPSTYVLEGSIAVTGAAVQWLRDQLGLIGAASEVEGLARSVPDNGGVYFVPAFSGLFAPRWRDDARGVIVGLTAYAR